MPKNILINLKLKGKRGKKGHRGPRGFKGHEGYIGNQGPTGINGFSGTIGSEGHMGPTGNIGHIGSIGPSGISGSTGSVGNPGHSTFTNNEFRLFQISKNISGNSKLIWPSEFNDVSNGINISDWSIVCIGTNYNVSDPSFSYQFKELSSLCCPNNSDNSWYLKHIMTDNTNDFTNGSMDFHLLGIPRSICVDVRYPKTFDIYSLALINGGITPYTGDGKNRVYLKVLNLSKSLWPSDLVYVNQIISFEYTVYSEINYGSTNLVDAKFRMTNLGIEEGNIFYAYYDRITHKSGPIPNSVPISDYQKLPYAVGTPGTGNNNSIIQTDQDFLKGVFGLYYTPETGFYTSNIINKTWDINGYWYVGYPEYLITNCECTKFMITYV